MVTQTASNVSLLRVGGAFVAIFSVVVAALILFVIPVACTFVGSIQLLLLGLLFIAGVVSFLFGQVLSRRRAKQKLNL
jgi:membrane protein implicated in regulation of membrane protease activity